MDKVISEVIPSLVETGVFGNVSFISAVPVTSSSILPHFASSVSFIKITVSSKENQSQKDISVVVKIQIDSALVRETRNSDVMFSNEITMYKDILPLLNSVNISPKFYYGNATGGTAPDKDILVIENLNNKGFGLSKQKWMLDLKHLLLSVNKLAEFHALSYIQKHERGDLFLNKAHEMKRVKMHETPDHSFTKLTYATMERGINYILTTNPEHSNTLNLFKKVIKNVEAWYDFLFKPQEPFAVICHGDFLKNNVLYSYNDKDEVADCRFFDFQNSVYASPAIDLSLFLYMHTTEELREEHWDTCLQSYWSALTAKLPQHIPVPLFEEFLQHFSERAIYAYCPCSFFIPMMMEDEPPNPDTFYSLPADEKIKFMLNCGGDRGIKLISDIVLHLIKKKYVENFLKSLPDDY